MAILFYSIDTAMTKDEWVFLNRTHIDNSILKHINNTTHVIMGR